MVELIVHLFLLVVEAKDEIVAPLRAVAAHAGAV